MATQEINFGRGENEDSIQFNDIGLADVIVNDPVQIRESKKSFMGKVMGFVGKFKPLLILVSMAYTAYSMYAAWKSYYNFEEVTDAYLNLLSNWKADMIKDVTTVGKGSSCPSGYKVLFSYSWPGSDWGCDCLLAYSTSKYYREMYTGDNCTTLQLSANCTNITNTSRSLMYGYENNAKFCYQTVSDTNILKTAANIHENGTCKDGFIACGGTADNVTFADNVCVNASQFGGGCPILALGYSMASDSNYIQIGNTSYYYTKNPNYSSPAINGIKINEGDNACSDDNTTQNAYRSYPLWNATVPRCDKNDSSFKKIGSGLGRRTFLTNNGLSVTNLDRSSYYFNDTQIINTFTRKTIGLSAKCRQEASTVIDSEPHLTEIKGYQKGIFYLAIFVVVFIGFLCACLELYATWKICRPPKRNANDVKADNKLRNHIFFCLIGKEIVAFILKLIHILLIGLTTAPVNAIRGFYQRLSELKCGSLGSDTDEKIKKLADQIDNYVYSQNYRVLWITIALVALDVVFFIKFVICVWWGKRVKHKRLRQVGPDTSSPDSKPGYVQPVPEPSGSNKIEVKTVVKPNENEDSKAKLFSKGA